MSNRDETAGSGDPIENLLNIGAAAVEDARRADEFAAAARQVREDLRAGRITAEEARVEFAAAFEQLIADL